MSINPLNPNIEKHKERAIQSYKAKLKKELEKEIAICNDDVDNWSLGMELRAKAANERIGLNKAIQLINKTN